jgi:glycosyltransferase involved in cell wall biosynthesis
MTRIDRRVSTVVTSYNQASFLREALTSIRQQSHSSVELIVVDAGSTDGSEEVLDDFSHLIDVLIREPDDGPADGLNKGLWHASGRYFTYLNSDDRLRSYALSEAVDSLCSRPDVAAVYGNGAIIDAAGRRMGTVRSRPFGLRQFRFGVALVMQPGSVYRTDAVRQVGGFNVANRTCWDMELLIDLALAGFALEHVSREWADFRLHHASISGSGANRREYLQDSQRLLEKALGRPPTWHDQSLTQLGRPLAALWRLGRLLSGTA